MKLPLALQICVLLVIERKAALNITVIPQPVLEGSPVELRCTLDFGMRANKVMWIRNSQRVATVSQITATPCIMSSFSSTDYIYRCDPPLVFYLTIPSVSSSEHNIQWECLDLFTGFPGVATIDVVVPVPSVTMTFPASDPVVVSLGTNQTFTCQTGGSRPEGRIEWYKDGQNVTVHGGTVTPSGDLYITTSDLTLPGTKDNRLVTVQCKAANDYNTVPVVSMNKTFEVLYKPDIDIGVTHTPPVIEGTLVTFTCTVDSNPPSSGNWSKAGSSLSDGINQTNGVLVIQNVHRSDDGAYRCTATNTEGTSSKEIHLDVYYPADNIDIQYSNASYTTSSRQLRCVPDGNPPTFRFLPWKHLSSTGQVIRELRGIDSNKLSILSLPDPGMDKRYQDTGYYVCYVTNEVENALGALVQSKAVLLEIKAPPILPLLISDTLGENAKSLVVKIPFYSFPPYTNVVWYYQNEATMANDVLVLVQEEAVDLVFHDQEVSVDGYQAVLIIISMADKHVGTYTLTVKNSIGEKNISFDVLNAESNETCAAPNIALLAVSVTVLIISLVIGGLGLFAIRRGRLLIRKSSENNQKKDTVRLSDLQKKDNSDDNPDDRRHYEQLDSSKIEKPNIYEGARKSTKENYYEN